MLSDTQAFSSFAVDDLEKAHDFYGGTLGLRTTRHDRFPLLTLHLEGGCETKVYERPDFTPATYTVLNFVVDDIEAAVDALAAKGLTFERYDGLGQDEKGIARGNGPSIAWFTDRARNILAVLEEAKP
jgi:catechol 2,3-dioxygenase-like lactoylglutathione lyase family enzyme